MGHGMGWVDVWDSSLKKIKNYNIDKKLEKQTWKP